MDNRHRMKLCVVESLVKQKATTEATAVTSWAIAHDVSGGKGKFSIPFMMRIIEVLLIEGYLETSSRRDEPARFWIARDSVLLELRTSLTKLASSVDEAHQRAETQLPKQDIFYSSDVESDES